MSIMAAVTCGDCRKSGLLVFILVFTTLGVTKTKQQDSFYFDPSPINQDVVEGLDALLRCDVSNRRQIQFYWTLNNRALANTSRRFQDDSNLRILRVDRVQDSGSFRCIATNVTTGIALRSTEAKLNISWINSSAIVELKLPNSREEIVENVEVNLRCHADGNPEPTVEWYRNRIRLSSSNRVRFTKNKIRIVNVTSSDNGGYSCRAINPAGTINSVQNFLLTIPGSGTPVLDVSSFTDFQLVKQSRSATFNCRYANASRTEWHFDQRRINNDTKYTVLENGTLIVSRTERRDEGFYRCVGLSANGAAQTYTAVLQLASLDDLTDASFEPKLTNPQVIPFGGKLDIRCLTPRGNPTPTQRWEGPFDEIGDQGRIRAADGVLSITAAEESDSGNYTCVVSNMDGTRSRSVWIVVSVPPKLSLPPLSVRVTEGESATFTCRVIGTPYPVTTVTWAKDELALDLANVDRVHVDPNGILRIDDVNMLDEGNYACSVNTIGHQPVLSSNAHLYVEKQLKFKPPLPSQKLELGSDAVIRCRADGRTTPRVRWIKVGQLELPEHIRDIQGTLNFGGVRAADTGEYMCIATNDQGTINMTVRVDVVVRPKFKVKPANTTAYEGHSTMLHCIATGDPEPAVQWDKNNKILVIEEHQNRLKILANGSLHITVVHMEDGGKYGCTAGNSGGLEREEVFLHVAGAESFVSGDGVGSNSANDSFNMMKTIVIAVCSAVAYLAIVVGLTVYCSIRLMRAKNQRKQRQPNDVTTNGIEKGENGMLPLETTELVEKCATSDKLVPLDQDAFSLSATGSHNSHSTHSRGSQRNYDKLNFPRKELQTLGMLGKGFYGDVFLAKAYVGLNGGCDSERLVVVKSLLSRNELHQSEFYREAELFSRVEHEHVVRAIGLCRDAEPMFLITEYCEWGDLKQFLLAMRKDLAAGARSGGTLGHQQQPSAVRLPPLTVAQQLNMCHQVSLGMEALANQRLTHRDLAARNILLSPTLDVKVASLSLSRDVYAAEYAPWWHRLVPVRWTAPEIFICADVPATVDSDIDASYTSSSDAFSFGIFVWELFTLGELPLRHMSDDDVMMCRRQLGNMASSAAVRLPIPPACPPELWHLAERCQAEFAGDRPTFAELSACIGEMIAAIVV